MTEIKKVLSPIEFSENASKILPLDLGCRLSLTNRANVLFNVSEYGSNFITLI
jgi:hypothetical protein